MAFNTRILTPNTLYLHPLSIRIFWRIGTSKADYFHTFHTCMDDTSYILDMLWCTLLHLHVHIAFSPWGLGMGVEQNPRLSNHSFSKGGFTNDYLFSKYSSYLVTIFKRNVIFLITIFISIQSIKENQNAVWNIWFVPQNCFCCASLVKRPFFVSFCG